jgi:glycosyltransferase involved in cell wall biosynthesis
VQVTETGRPPEFLEGGGCRLRTLPRRYFDITDLVSYARAHRAVSGIQRVQIRVLRCLGNSLGGAGNMTASEAEKQLCLFSTGRLTPVRACRVEDLFAGEDYEPETFLQKLGLEGPAEAFTSRELVDHLAAFRKGSVTRAVQKARLQLLGRSFPATARAMMKLPPRLSSRSADSGSVAAIPTVPHARPESGDTLVLIGSNWNVSRIEALARRHARRGGRVVQVIYDLIPYRYPEFFSASQSRKFKAYLERSVSFTSRYVCISEATAADMRQYLKPQRTHAEVMVWPLAHEFDGYVRNHRGTIPTDTTLLNALDKPFVLCVGTIEVRKNGVLLLEVWQKLLRELGDRTPQLIFAGHYGWKIDRFRRLLEDDQRLRERVRIVSTPTDADLAALYERCLFGVYPSLVEGWGLPVGEAAWFGRATIASSSSSLPEVLGPLAEYAGPDDVDGFVRAVSRMTEDAAYRMAREREITAAPLRTWADVASSFSQLLD